MGYKIILSVFVFAATMSSASFASGFKCEGDEGYRVKLFNHVQPENGTRTPSALIISQTGEGTLLSRLGNSITKRTRLNTVQYVVDGNSLLGAEQAILQIAFREGLEVLAAGETAEGQLILVGEDDRQVIDLTCTRYLKN